MPYLQLLELKVKKLHPDAILPTCAHPGQDLGFDLYALEDTVLLAHRVTRVRTGIAVAMKGFGFRIADRSSMAMRGVRTSGGTIDEGYTGEMFANLLFVPQPGQLFTKNQSDLQKRYQILAGDRIAQFIPQRVYTNLPVVEVQELPVSDRGAGGYGSTGK